jgi:hypothetical protein
MTSQIPDPTFETLVSTFATQAAMGLGQIPNPVTNKAEEDLRHAKFAIDMLQLLEEKTQGNRTADEDKFLADLLYQLRMVYIEKAK